MGYIGVITLILLTNLFINFKRDIQVDVFFGRKITHHEFQKVHLRSKKHARKKMRTNIVGLHHTLDGSEIRLTTWDS